MTFDAAIGLAVVEDADQSHLATITTEEEHDHLAKSMMTRFPWQSGYIGARPAPTTLSTG